MAEGMWCTKEEVLKDLEMVSGQKVTDVDDGFFVVGNQPPPPLVHNYENDEIELRFGRRKNIENLSQDEYKPHLNGITQSIRMVEDFEHESDEEKGNNNILVVSKLNPMVKEFVPSCSRSKNSSPVLFNQNNTTISRKSSDILFDNNDKTKNSTSDSVVLKEHSNEDKKLIAARLKSKILIKPETFEEKRDTNSAIVNLLKLYVKPHPESTPKLPKLLTPDYFKNSKASEFETTQRDCSEIKSTLSCVKKVANEAMATQKGESHIDSGLFSKIEELNKNDHNSFQSDMAVSDKTEVRAPTVVLEKALDPNIAESINKVNHWFDYKPEKKQKPKSPVLFLGTVSYKRKDPVPCKSPSILEKKLSKPATGDYKPSIYAEELLQKYNKKKEVASPKRHLNIWEKLEEDLKKKDEQIRTRRPLS